MRIQLAASTLLVWLFLCASVAKADLILTFEEQSGGSVNLRLTGQLQISGPDFVPGSDDGTTFAILADMRSIVGNDSLTAQSFQLTSGLTRFGPAPSSVVNPLSPPPFEFGFTGNSILLPPTYTSGTILDVTSVNYVASLAALNLNVGDSWGVSFTDGAGGTQTLAFRASTVAVPEPDGLVYLAPTGAMIIGFRRRKSDLARYRKD
ncbi:MAG TPA: hypothetical protein DDW52_19885 [Planctomycetaceae bacterium]|nr:hypothetical protein [Planctomycetaceae bacterium]